ncbi:MAG: hypothetical protein C5B60_05500 [Chloroflexi bacterium]|nr:MAG: hypothetical protein C5B60_05500 [Chloroflexota bacterium]
MSRARDGDAWTKHYDEMARKTVLRRILKLAPSSIEQLNRAMDEEDQAERGETIPADFSDLGVMPMLDDDQPDPAMTKSDELAQKLQEGREKGGAAET